MLLSASFLIYSELDKMLIGKRQRFTCDLENKSLATIFFRRKERFTRVIVTYNDTVGSFLAAR